MCEELNPNVLYQIAQVGDIVVSAVPWRTALSKFMVEVVYRYHHASGLSDGYCGTKETCADEINTNDVNGFS
jgi:hypothetical protein